MKKLAVIFFVFGLYFWQQDIVLAAKPRPARGSQSSAATVGRSSSSSGRGVKAGVRFRSDRKALLLSFPDFGQAVSATYSLTYTSNGISQGARSTVTPETAGGERELLFGTCSKGVCRYHSNITNARLVIDSKLSSGVIIRKPYRIRL